MIQPKFKMKDFDSRILMNVIVRFDDDIIGASLDVFWIAQE
jgi:hypothetical protein